MDKRNFSHVDKFLVQLDQAISTCVPGASQPRRDSPAQLQTENKLSESEKKLIAGLMRINHTGEVCAQALYAGQALTAKLGKVRESMQDAAQDETDHYWCAIFFYESNCGFYRSKYLIGRGRNAIFLTEIFSK